MKPRITVITIGVDDLERSLAFYRDGLSLTQLSARLKTSMHSSRRHVAQSLFLAGHRAVY